MRFITKLGWPVSEDCRPLAQKRKDLSVQSILISTLMIATLGASASAQATYQYQGNPFTFFSCGPNADDTATMDCSTPAPTNTHTSYTATDHVTATLTLDTPLGPNFPYSDVSTLPGFQLTLDDGQHTVSTPITAGQGLFSFVSTDASGQINQWRLGINTGGALNGGIATFNFTDISGAHVFDEGVLSCCDPAPPGNLAINFGIPGTWNSGIQNPATLVTNLINLVSNPSLNLTSGQISSLTDKLNNALASIQAGLNKQAINQLNAFISSVESSVKTRKMSAQTGNTLIDAANAIIAKL
jgi:hypothetical protein